MIQFYAPDIASTLTLPQDDSSHCVRVLRAKPGDTVWVVDGRGTRYECRLTTTDPRAAKVEIVGQESIPNVWGADITVAVAPTKNADRIEWLVEKLVEMGVDRIIPLLCDHSERKVLKSERLERIAVSAMKQSLKATLPIIEPLTPFAEALRIIESATDRRARFIAHCEHDKPRTLLATEVAPDLPTAIMIGPEGDFSPREIEAALAAGFKPVSLGECRLRTETAAMAAAQTVHTIRQLHLS